MDQTEQISEQTDETPSEATVTKLTTGEKQRFKRACALVERSEARQLRYLIRQFNDETLGPDEERVAA
jgi:hypothetical protein